MKTIDQVDTNFRVEASIQESDLCFYDARTSPFRIYGLLYENGRFCRMPQKLAETVSDGVYALCTNTSGGRVRFVTNSSCVAISAQMDHICRMPHFAFTGSSGFDLYADYGEGSRYVRSFIPPLEMETGYESLIELPGEPAERLITIHFPTYSDVLDLKIGLQAGASVKAPPDYTYETPIVYYGSSITQGGCASRPGNTYQAILSRLLDCNFINLGFSGNAKGEPAMASYLTDLDMLIFVLDYDHNAPNSKHLERTHEPLYRAIREKHPALPILMMSRPKYYLSQEEQTRQRIVESTYRHALESGDRNVYFFPGNELITKEAQNIATVDSGHPNDYGFSCMACALKDLLEKLLKA